VPNYSAGGTKSIDRTEPPIGAKVMLEMYNKFKDLWIVELLFDDLLAWNTWFVEERMLGPLGIISLGSDTIDGYKDAAAGQMQGARYESGLGEVISSRARAPLLLKPAERARERR
jgi:putative isomerase